MRKVWSRQCRSALPSLTDFRYDAGVLLRFAVLAVPLLLLVFALFDGVAGAWDLLPRAIEAQPARITFGGWLLQAAGLTALYLLIRGRTGHWWLDGLAVGWTAWLFRGPLVVVAVAGIASQSQQAWWRLSIVWWWLYCLCGLLLAALARRLIVAPSASPPPSSEVLPNVAPAAPSPPVPPVALD